jgi:hypothetical protein
MSEAIVQKWVQDQLKKEFGSDIYIFKVPQGQYTSRRGIPDLIAGIHGQFVAIEVKTDVGKLTPTQTHEISKIQSAGSKVYTIFGKDVAMIQRIVGEIRNAI